MFGIKDNFYVRDPSTGELRQYAELTSEVLQNDEVVANILGASYDTTKNLNKGPVLEINTPNLVGDLKTGEYKEQFLLSVPNLKFSRLLNSLYTRRYLPYVIKEICEYGVEKIIKAYGGTPTTNISTIANQIKDTARDEITVKKVFEFIKEYVERNGETAGLGLGDYEDVLRNGGQIGEITTHYIYKTPYGSTLGIETATDRVHIAAFNPSLAKGDKNGTYSEANFFTSSDAKSYQARSYVDGSARVTQHICFVFENCIGSGKKHSATDTYANSNIRNYLHGSDVLGKLYSVIGQKVLADRVLHRTGANGTSSWDWYTEVFICPKVTNLTSKRDMIYNYNTYCEDASEKTWALYVLMPFFMLKRQPNTKGDAENWAWWWTSTYLNSGGVAFVGYDGTVTYGVAVDERCVSGGFLI